MKRFFIVYGHYDDNSFNAAIRDTFIESAKNSGHHIDLLDLYKENFNPVFAGEEPDTEVLNHRKGSRHVILSFLLLQSGTSECLRY